MLVIGTGGLGSPAALYLTAAGVGRLGIADADVVDLSNPQGRCCTGHRILGGRRWTLPGRRCTPSIRRCRLRSSGEYVTKDNIMELVGRYDFVLDCTDNFPTKFLINDACVQAACSVCARRHGVSSAGS